MIKIKIICIGKLKEKYWIDAFTEYKKRLTPFCNFELMELDECKINSNPSSFDIKLCLDSEGKKIISKIPPSAHLISLCIEGVELSSLKLAKYIENISVHETSEIIFIIGGSYGLSDFVKHQSKFLLSMSQMTFPHQMARVILCEQIYRAFQIMSKGKYHK